MEALLLKNNFRAQQRPKPSEIFSKRSLSPIYKEEQYQHTPSLNHDVDFAKEISDVNGSQENSDGNDTVFFRKAPRKMTKDMGSAVP